MEHPSSFFNTLFDFSFEEFITIKIIKILYGISIFLAAIAALGFMISGFSDSFFKGILYLIISPVIFILYTVMARVWLEIIMAVFNISEKVTEIAKIKNEKTT